MRKIVKFIINDMRKIAFSCGNYDKRVLDMSITIVQ